MFVKIHQRQLETGDPHEHTAKICWQVLQAAIFEILRFKYCKTLAHTYTIKAKMNLKDYEKQMITTLKEEKRLVISENLQFIRAHKKRHSTSSLGI